MTDVPLTTLQHNCSEILGALGDEETERHLCVDFLVLKLQYV